MRPHLQLLDAALITQILDEARDLLQHLGVRVHNPQARELFGQAGAQVDAASQRVHLSSDVIDRALQSSPRHFALHDQAGQRSCDFSGKNVHFTPGSAALHLLDEESGALRRPSCADYARYARVVDGLTHVASQSTCMVPVDVPERAGDSIRLYLSLLHGRKPVVTGCFTAEAFAAMHEMQLIVRGSAEALRAQPLCVFSCCPTSPLSWSDTTSQNLLDCARAGIPVEFISMPLAGFIAPVTLVGSLVEHTAETLSGIVLAQAAAPGAPMLYGGSPAAFDIRYETTPMGAVETQMIDCAYAEIGQHLGLPTQAYIGMSDAKLLDAQAGLESAMGATLAALAGINNVSGPGMLDFENAFSLDKLVLDNELCGLALRLTRGIAPRDDFPARPLFEELLRDGHLLIARHTRRHLKQELHYPGPVLDRMNRARYVEEGSRDLRARSRSEIARLLAAWQPPPLDAAQRRALDDRMLAELRRHGMERLPELA